MNSIPRLVKTQGIFFLLCLALHVLYMQGEDLFPANSVMGIAFCSFIFSPFFTLFYKYLVNYLYTCTLIN